MILYDIGIVGFWYGKNYGSILTYYSLYKAIECRGYKCILINKPLNLWDDSFYGRDTLANRFFIREKCNRSRIRKDKYDWSDLNNFCNMFICGSDVVWKYTLLNRVGCHFFLDFVWENKKKISYASSFGGDWKGNNNDTRHVAYYLKKFQHISCREKEGVELLTNTFGIKADQVLDPVFLIDYSIYDGLATKSKCSIPENYILSYILGPGKSKRDMLVDLQMKKPYCELINLVNAGNEEKGSELLGLTTLKGIEVEDWLKLIRNCNLYIGDSFHGICFSIIFKKNFILIRNRISPSRSRFDSLLSICGLESRSIYADEDISKRPDLLADIDYDEVYKKINSYIEYSNRWLTDSLSSSYYGQVTDYDILMEKYISLEKEVNILRDMLNDKSQNKEE